MADVRISLQTLRVLSALLQSPLDKRYGLELSRATGLAAGTLYPILARLERAGWLMSEWEESDPKADGRPRRRYYRLSEDGAEWARDALIDAARTLTFTTDPWPKPAAGGVVG
jgi:PadR family transcriptional regulator